MKKVLTLSIFLSLSVSVFGNVNPSMWQLVPNENVTSIGERKLFPTNYSSFYLNSASLKSLILLAGNTVETAIKIEFPTPDGKMRTFKIWETPMMEIALAEKYPEIKTFTGYALDNKGATIKLDLTYKGFHAKVFDAKNTFFIDPYSDANDGFYICYYKKDYPKPAGKQMECHVGDATDELGIKAMTLADSELSNRAFKIHGTTKKEYRLALACTGEYAAAVAGSSLTKANVLSAMVTSVNRVNGVYERELAVTMKLIANNDALIYLNGSSDPYSNTNTSAMLTENQNTINSIIGSANYDLGHVFGTGNGGQAQFRSVCNNSDKAEGVTGLTNPVGDPFDIDYVAHEMGHQFGANHTFNANSCGSNTVNAATAFEPGSGSTLMAYTGICASGDNMQNNSDDYFHAVSLVEISNYITIDNGATCPVQATIANIPPSIPAFTQSYPIPFLTAFELTAPTVIDSDHDVLNYCWEQWNKGNKGSGWSNANLKGPIYRSFDPSLSPTRVFTVLPKLLNNVINYKGEKLPEDNRFLTFKLTVRDMLAGLGTFNFPDDTVHLDVINTGSPFAITSPNTNVNWITGSTETVTWDVSSTNTAPINATSVDILLSTDGGYTYPTILASNTPNDGSENISIPVSINTVNARVKVKAVGNVFFDISNSNFTITDFNNVPKVNNEDFFSIYPNPASESINIISKHNNKLVLRITNTLGQTVWNGLLNGQQTIKVSAWAKGVYYLQLSDAQTHEKAVKKFIVQ